MQLTVMVIRKTDVILQALVSVFKLILLMEHLSMILGLLILFVNGVLSQVDVRELVIKLFIEVCFMETGGPSGTPTCSDGWLTHLGINSCALNSITSSPYAYITTTSLLMLNLMTLHIHHQYNTNSWHWHN